LGLHDREWIEVETNSGRKKTQFISVSDSVMVTADGVIQLSNVRAVFYA
jgi:hypothetical protein